MIGKEELYNEESTEMKVIDKRKFNPDGSLREGVVLEEAPPKSATTVESPIIISNDATSDMKDVEMDASELSAEEDDLELTEDDFPDADNPAGFVNFLSTLASQAAAALGALPHPATGKRSVDLDTGKYWIDVLVMLRDKTEGNLHQQEQKLFNGLLSDLQMQYVALTRANEEQLKKQAAQKFSASDILGKN